TRRAALCHRRPQAECSLAGRGRRRSLRTEIGPLRRYARGGTLVMPAFGNHHNFIGAGWSVYWKIPVASAGGLEVWWADFQGHRVLWRGSQPFALVPYHGGSPTFKDGLDSHCGGAPFTA